MMIVEYISHAAVPARSPLRTRRAAAAIILQPMSPKHLANPLHGILLIADEVQSGFCRTGQMFASQYWQDAPS